MGRPAIRSLVGGAAGIAAGVLGGIGLGASPPEDGPTSPSAAAIDAAHVPPLLSLPGEAVTLRYAIVCPPRDDGAPCDGSGEVYARPGQSGEFTKLQLRRGDNSRDGRYFVELPTEIASARDGFSYYALLRDNSSGATITVPSGGAAAPQRSLQLHKPAEVRLATHAFGRVRKPDARLVDAPWGSDLGEVGLSGSRELGFAGPSAFDVSAVRDVTLLDGVNRRVERWSRGRASAIPIGTVALLADFVVEADGTLDVLEPPTRETPFPRLVSFRRDGSERWSQRLADRTWAKLAIGPDGPVVQQQPSEQWLPAAENGRPLARAAQLGRGRAARPLANGHGVLVQRVGDTELRVAETVGETILRAWRIVTTTPLGEVQLAEPVGDRLVVVVKTYDEGRDEFDVLVLEPSGVTSEFALPSAAWSESAPLARFRISGSSLYQLGSTPKGAFVDRFDLEASR